MKIWLAIKACCLILVTLTLSIFLLEFRGLIRDVRLSVRMSDAVLGNVNDASLETAQMAKTASGALTAETAKLTATIDEARRDGRASRATLDSFRQVLIDVHQQVVPQAIQTLAQLNSNETLLMEELKPSIVSVNRGAAALADAASDPNIKKSFANVAETTGQLALIATDGRQVADKARETYMKPVNLWWALVKQLISTGGSVAQMVK